MRGKSIIKGFTLIEVLIAMSLTVLIGGVLYLLQSTGSSTVIKGTSQLIMASEIRNTMEMIVNDIRNSKEVLDIEPDMIKIRTYKYSLEKPDPGEDSLVTVTYEVEREGRHNTLWRTENRSNPIKMLAMDKINKGLFTPLYEVYDKGSPSGWSYLPFDMVSNDSGQRQKISMIRLKLDFVHLRDKSVVITSVNLRPAMSRLRQPNWKYR